MEKRGARILLGCLAFSVLLAVILVLALRLVRPGCELLVSEPRPVGASVGALLNSSRKLRSQDGSLILRISAYLDCGPLLDGELASAPPSASQTAAAAAGGGQPLQGLHVQHIVQRQVQGKEQLQQQQQQQLQHGQPVAAAGASLAPSPPPATAVLSGSLPVAAGARLAPPAATSWPTTAAPAPVQPPPASTRSPGTEAPVVLPSSNQSSPEADSQPAPGQGRPRFLAFEPLRLEAQAGEQLEGPSWRRRYWLASNCSSITLVFGRQAGRVQLERGQLELRLGGRPRLLCELQLAQPASLAAELRPWGPGGELAHYHCERAQVLACLERGSRRPLAELRLRALQFQLASSAAASEPTPHEFSVAGRSECAAA